MQLETLEPREHQPLPPTPTPAQAARPKFPLLALQRTAGNRAVTAKLARADKSPKLRTALDSKLVVTPAGGGYSAALQFGEDSVQVASYTPKGDTPINRLPVYLEDIVSGGEAVVNVRYDPAAADVKAAFETREVDGVKITVRLQPQSAEDLTVKSTNAAKQTGDKSANVHGAETVQAHSGSSATDKIMGSIASAEGGFASTEGTDAGVLTWGQGQWTVTAGELQKVLAFIKERRRDLFDKYWGAADLDVAGKDFVHDGKHWTNSKTDMMKLFRPNAETILGWANRFGQAGMDPQIQRLQREYLRGEVHATLNQHIGGHTPEAVLDTRGQAYFYSMDKNWPRGAKENFQAALKQAGIAKDGEPSAEQKQQASEAIGELFKNSSVIAMDIAKHHIIAFWGEGGRKKAVKQADDAIAAGGDATWNVERWKKHRANMEARVDRYQKTKADIDKALARQDVEPDVPAGTFATDAAADAPAPAAAAAPTGPGLYETVSEGIGHLVDDAATILALAATGTGLKELQIATSVGRGGKNAQADVAAVCARMLGVGYAPGASLTALGDAIARYQAEVVGMRRPDGRIDPGGRTLGALRAGTKAPASAPANGSAPAAPPAPAPAAPAPAAPAAPVAAPVPRGPRAALGDGELEALVNASHSPAVDAAAAKLAQLEADFKALQRDKTHNQEMGQGRDDLVAGFAVLRSLIAALEPALQPHFYRAINKISPYYFQGDNIILEFDRRNKVTGKPEHVWNTCNITALAMTLEALGKSPADYKHPELIPAIARVHKGDVEHRTLEQVGSELTGLRLPDYIAMAAIVWQMGYKEGDDAAILAASNAAFEKVPKTAPGSIKTLAGDFGVSATTGQLTLDAGGRRDRTADRLSSYGKDHWKTADLQAIDETEAGTPQARARNAGKLSNAAVESEIPLERYKQSALAQLGPVLDAGRQVVAGQYNHFVRLQAVDDEFVTKDDPGRYTGANEKATWEEARAMGLFTNWILIG